MKKNKYSTAQQPLISFCISTYKRKPLLKTMITKLLQQKYQNFEVIICDNDPKGSSRKTVEAFHSPKIFYHTNPKDLGMVNSFNKAFKLSKGEFIVFVSDDDPPYPNMLQDLVEQYYQHPECVAYFGAYDLFIPDEKLAQTIAMPVGYHSCRNFDWKKGEVKIFSPKEYVKKALNGEIFYYLMWSTGMVKRAVVEKIGAIPTYGSALMTDRSYCIKVGTFGKTLILNTELASQLVHTQSFSLTSADADILTTGFVGYYKDIQPFIKKYKLVDEHEAFVTRHLVNMFMIIRVGNEVRSEVVQQQFLMTVFDSISQQLPFLKKHRLWIFLMLWHRFPFEIMFKMAQLPPKKLLKTVYRFIKYRSRKS